MKIRKSHHAHISIYPLFLQLAAVTFLVVVISHLLPVQSDEDSSNIVGQILYILLLAAQWWLQIAVVIFMTQRDTEKESIRKTIYITTSIVLAMAALSIFGIIGKDTIFCEWCGVVFVEAALSLLFGVFLLIPLQKFLPDRYTRKNKSAAFTNGSLQSNSKRSHKSSNRYYYWLNVRPAAFRWAIFQFISHILFLLVFIYMEQLPNSDTGNCLILTSDAIYYILYVPLLWITLRTDSQYWRRKGALLLYYNETQSDMEDSEPFSTMTRISSKDLQLFELIGIGNFGEVYRANWISKDIEVAVKKIKINSIRLMMDSLLKEASLLQELHHENIIKFYGMCIDLDCLSLVTEYMDKGSLYNIIHSGEPSRAEDCEKIKKSITLKLQLLLDISKGMQYLHSRNPIIIHRDLKSHNILVDKFWRAKVCDFGVARIKEFTKTMSQVGTVQWLAPEVLSESAYNEKVDSFSFGVVIWELFTFEVPWGKMHPLRVVSAVAFENSRLEIPSNCHPLVQSLMEDCFDEPAKRPDFPTIVQMLEDISKELQDKS